MWTRVAVLSFVLMSRLRVRAGGMNKTQRCWLSHNNNWQSSPAASYRARHSGAFTTPAFKRLCAGKRIQPWNIGACFTAECSKEKQRGKKKDYPSCYLLTAVLSWCPAVVCPPQTEDRKGLPVLLRRSQRPHSAWSGVLRTGWEGLERRDVINAFEKELMF